jgi:hypothetical protein
VLQKRRLDCFSTIWLDCVRRQKGHRFQSSLQFGDFIVELTKGYSRAFSSAIAIGHRQYHNIRWAYKGRHVAYGAVKFI